MFPLRNCRGFRFEPRYRYHFVLAIKRRIFGRKTFSLFGEGWKQMVLGAGLCSSIFFFISFWIFCQYPTSLGQTQIPHPSTTSPTQIWCIAKFKVTKGVLKNLIFVFHLNSFYVGLSVILWPLLQVLVQYSWDIMGSISNSHFVLICKLLSICSCSILYMCEMNWFFISPLILAIWEIVLFLMVFCIIFPILCDWSDNFSAIDIWKIYELEACISAWAVQRTLKHSRQKASQDY